MISLEEISSQIKEGKKKYGKALIYHIMPKVNDGTPLSVIVKWLKDNYDIDLSENRISRLKSYYSLDVEKINKTALKNSNNFKNTNNAKKVDVVQNQDKDSLTDEELSLKFSLSTKPPETMKDAFQKIQ